MAIWHLGFSSTKRGALLPNEAQRREAIRALARVAGDRLALFSIVNEHKHLLAQERERRIKRLGGEIRTVLNAVVEEPLNEPWIERVDGTRHKQKLLRYFLTQPSHHEIGVHDALWTGSCFLDLAGARIVNGLQLCIWDLLPGVPRSVIFEHVGLPPQPIEPCSLAQIRVLGAVRLVAAASAALAVDPLLRGRSHGVLRARVLAVSLGRRAEIPASEVRWAMGLPKSSYYRAAEQSADEEGMLAVRTRLAIEEAVAKATRSIPVTELGQRLRLCR